MIELYIDFAILFIALVAVIVGVFYAKVYFDNFDQREAYEDIDSSDLFQDVSSRMFEGLSFEKLVKNKKSNSSEDEFHLKLVCKESGFIYKGVKQYTKNEAAVFYCRPKDSQNLLEVPYGKGEPLIFAIKGVGLADKKYLFEIHIQDPYQNDYVQKVLGVGYKSPQIEAPIPYNNELGKTSPIS